MIFEKLKTLEEILIERLPRVIMWSEVGLFFPGDKFPPGTIIDENLGPKPGYFFIMWYHKRREDNPHPCIYKEIPFTLDEINSVIKRQREKLRTESENA